MYSTNDRASDRVRQKNGKFCGIFKGNYAARKAYYAANDAIFLKLI